MKLQKDLKEFIGLLNSHNVKYIKVYILSKRLLIQNKLAVGRDQDIADVKRLQQLDDPKV
jgi:hypothetical protein